MWFPLVKWSKNLTQISNRKSSRLQERKHLLARHPYRRASFRIKDSGMPNKPGERQTHIHWIRTRGRAGVVVTPEGSVSRILGCLLYRVESNNATIRLG